MRQRWSPPARNVSAALESISYYVSRETASVSTFMHFWPLGTGNRRAVRGQESVATFHVKRCVYRVQKGTCLELIQFGSLPRSYEWTTRFHVKQWNGGLRRCPLPRATHVCGPLGIGPALGDSTVVPLSPLLLAWAVFSRQLPYHCPVPAQQRTPRLSMPSPKRTACFEIEIGHKWRSQT